VPGTSPADHCCAAKWRVATQEIAGSISFSSFSSAVLWLHAARITTASKTRLLCTLAVDVDLVLDVFNAVDGLHDVLRPALRDPIIDGAGEHHDAVANIDFDV